MGKNKSSGAPRTQAEMERVVQELKKAHSCYPGSLDTESDQVWLASLIHHLNARVLDPDEHRRISHDNPSLEKLANL